MRVEIGQLIAQIISFLIMLWVLKRYAWKPILELLQKRRDKIQSEFDSIAQQKQEMEQLKTDYSQKVSDLNFEATAKMQEAVKKGQEVAKQIQNDARQEGKEIIRKAQEDAQKEIGKAKGQLKTELVNISLAITEKVLHSTLDQDKQKRLIEQFVNQVELH